VVSLILAATAVDQALFVPATVMATILVNMITGIIIWRDWVKITLWLAYITVHLIMVLGIYLLTPEDMITAYRNEKWVEEAVKIAPHTIENLRKASTLSLGQGGGASRRSSCLSMDPRSQTTRRRAHPLNISSVLEEEPSSEASSEAPPSSTSDEASAAERKRKLKPFRKAINSVSAATPRKSDHPQADAWFSVFESRVAGHSLHPQSLTEDTPDQLRSRVLPHREKTSAPIRRARAQAAKRNQEAAGASSMQESHESAPTMLPQYSSCLDGAFVNPV